MVKTIIGFLSLFVLPSCGKCLNLDKQPGMCAKLPMAADGIVPAVESRGLSGISRRVYEVCDRSGRNLPAYRAGGADHVCGQRKGESPQDNHSRNLCEPRGLRSHVASEHFQKYKQGTLHMVKTLVLSDQTPLNPANRINNFIQ